eukprot:752274-Hanusia_phi.AAC.5
MQRNREREGEERASEGSKKGGEEGDRETERKLIGGQIKQKARKKLAEWKAEKCTAKQLARAS